MDEETILTLKGYKQFFQLNKHIVVKAVDGVSFSIRKGEIVGLVGESGCGKSTLARGIAGIYRPTEGEIYYKDYLISRALNHQQKKEIQRNIQIIFQDSVAALNPKMTVEDIVAEPLAINRFCQNTEQMKQRVIHLLEHVGLDHYALNKLPHEMSGGQRQRVNIARSLALDPQLIIADEPIASLDVSMQAQIVSLFQALRERKKIAFLFIAHDLAMVRYISDRVGVMYKGKLVEIAPTEALFSSPQHAYTQALISSMPIPDPIVERNKRPISFTLDKTLLRQSTHYRQVSPEHWVLESD